MPNYNGDGTSSGFLDFGSTDQNSTSTLDWLNNGLNSLGNTALKGYDTYYKVKSLSKTANDAAQKNYQDSSQAVGGKNLIHGVDNNYVLLGIAAAVGLYIVLEG